MTYYRLRSLDSLEAYFAAEPLITKNLLSQMEIHCD